MHSRYLYLLRFILFISDLLLVNLALSLSAVFVDGDSLKDYAHNNHFVVINLIWLISTMAFRMYGEDAVSRIETIYRLTWRSIVLHLVLFVFFLAFSEDSGFSRSFLLAFYCQLGFYFLLSRFMGTYFETRMLNRFQIRRSVAVLGMNKTGLRLASYFADSNNDYYFDGFLNDQGGLYVSEDGELHPGACEELKNAAHRGVKEVFVSVAPERMEYVNPLVMEAEKQCVRLKLVPDLSDAIGNPYSFSFMGEFPVVNLRKEPLEDINNRFKKRVFDILFSGLVIVFLLSWLFPLLAIIIKLQSRGPVLFRQLRTGRDNKSFVCYKFRSMRVNKESDRKQAEKNDNRITPIGRFLRRSSLDELPQFFNVFLGNMSVVGPRPHMLQHTEQYKSLIDRYMVRQFLKPGISGWAQVNGYRGETKDQSLMEARVEHDIWYIENWSAMLDVRIVFMTVINMLRGEENAH